MFGRTCANRFEPRSILPDCVRVFDGECVPNRYFSGTQLYSVRGPSHKSEKQPEHGANYEGDLQMNRRHVFP